MIADLLTQAPAFLAGAGAVGALVFGRWLALRGKAPPKMKP